MRLLALVLRAGAVVVAAAVAFSLLVGGAPKPRVIETAQAAGAATSKPAAQVTKPKPAPAYPAGVVTIVATGDIVMGSTPNLPPSGGRTFFDDVKTDLAGDVVIGNLEQTLTTVDGSKCGASSTNCFAFKSPPRTRGGSRARSSPSSTPPTTMRSTSARRASSRRVTALQRQRLLHTGRPGEIAVVQQVGDIRVAVVGFAPYPWANDITDLAAVRRLVAKAAKQADIVVATAHMGAEGSDKQHVRAGTETFLGEDHGDPVRFAHAAIDAGADLVVGSGPHVLRGMEWYKGRLIAYSLGNFAGYPRLLARRAAVE